MSRGGQGRCRVPVPYDKLGQVTSGKRYWSDGTVVAGQQFDSAFDDIGNRNSTKVGGDVNGLNQRSATYSANNLNQYTSRTVPAQVNVSGIALPASTMTVNSQATSRKGEYYWGEATANNSSAADFLSITSLATFGSTNNSTNGYVFVPKTPEAFSYDADGNLTNDGRWVYTWDGENRLIQLESQTTAPSASKRKITYTYDYQSRLIARKSYTNNGSYQIKSDTKYLNDGWRCLAEINAANNNLIRSYVWGLDLSGSLEGAGGIGGLLMLTDAATSTSHFYAYDGNGNVSGMAKTSDSSKTAHYEYGPFGEVVRASGTIAKSNPVRFSTKCQDEESDLLYYGYRFYNASTGRWPSRDPIEEAGGLNIYGFVDNAPISQVDLYGLVCDGKLGFELPNLLLKNKWQWGSGLIGLDVDYDINIKGGVKTLNGSFEIYATGGGSVGFAVKSFSWQQTWGDFSIGWYAGVSSGFRFGGSVSGKVTGNCCQLPDGLKGSICLKVEGRHNFDFGIKGTARYTGARWSWQFNIGAELVNDYGVSFEKCYSCSKRGSAIHCGWEKGRLCFDGQSSLKFGLLSKIITVGLGSGKKCVEVF